MSDCGHGWVHKNPNGVVAKCGGPAICKDCMRDENEDLKRKVKFLTRDRRAFAEETQKYRDAWLKDQQDLQESKCALKFYGNTEAYGVEEFTTPDKITVQGNPIMHDKGKTANQVLDKIGRDTNPCKEVLENERAGK